jgi:DNA primase
MALPPRFLDELRSRLTLSEVVGRRVKLVRAGREFRACCPFHNEKSPSFYVNDGKGFFHCFGCGAHGDAIGFVMRAANLPFMEAVEQLASEAGLDVPQASPEEYRRFERQKTLHDLVDQACRWFERQLREPAGREALAYLRRRGLDDAAIARFRLGYAPADAGALRRHLAEASWTDDDMVEAGLCKRPEEGNRAPYAFFRDRVLFAVSDRRGRVVAFGGRILGAESGPKYLNTGETPLFHKGQLLYNLSHARQAAAEGTPYVVAEGYMDVIALVRAGFEGAVAPLGTALTEAQVGLLWSLAPAGNRTPILCFDGDAAGQRAARRAVERILPMLKPDHSVRIAFMPPGQDPDDLIKGEGRAAMQRVLDAAVPVADVAWAIAIEGRRLDTPEARAGLKTDLEALVRQIADRDVQSFYRQEMMSRLDALVRPARAGGGGRQGAGQGAGRGGGQGGERRPWDPSFRRLPPDAQRQLLRWGANPPQRRAAETLSDERVLLATLVNHPAIFSDVGEQLAEAGFAAPALDGLRAEIVSIMSAKPDLDRPSLARHLVSLGYGPVLDDIASVEPLYAFARADAPADMAMKGWLDAWDFGPGRFRRVRELKEAGRLAGAEVTETNVRRIVALKEEIALANRRDDDDFLSPLRPSQAEPGDGTGG